MPRLILFSTRYMPEKRLERQETDMNKLRVIVEYACAVRWVAMLKKSQSLV